MLRWVKRLLIGRPLPSHAAPHQRLSNTVALAVFASDALSSVAYATEEILIVLVGAGAAAWWRTLGIAATIVALLGIVLVSYRQTIRAHPAGASAYLVAKGELGRLPSLTAGAALLVDYVLTAAVSVAAGVAAITSAFPSLSGDRVTIAGLVLFVIVVMNLRGVKESGRAFAAPTYAFLAAMALLLVWGFLRRPFASPEAAAASATAKAAGLWVWLRAFASGCTALTGVEAISDGVPAFRPPEADNANRTLRRMGFILAVLFAGITALALLYRVTPRPDETVVSQIARHVFGTSPLYYAVQAATALVLLLAANTSFADFPRLASLMARDRFLPRQLASLGDRLAFSNGIVLLGLLAWLLIARQGGDVHGLIPLYAVGVFLSFTISQSGMVAHWLRSAEPGARGKAAVNLVGAAATGGVLAVVVATKFAHGAWIVCVVIPALVAWFLRIERHYASAARQLCVTAPPSPRPLRHTVVVPVAGLHRGVVRALEYARSLTPRIRAVTVNLDEDGTARLRDEWAHFAADVPLVVLDSPYRSVIEPLVEYFDRVEAEREDDLVTVVVPEFVPKRLWHRMLHNQTALLLGAALSARPNIVVTTVRIPLED